MTTIEDRIMTLEAENKELRNLWVETEQRYVKLATKLDEFIYDTVTRKIPTKKWWKFWSES